MKLIKTIQNLVEEAEKEYNKVLESTTNMKEIEYLAFPRIIGHAEIGWTPENMREWNDYKSRLIRHKERLKIMGINYYESKLIAP